MSQPDCFVSGALGVVLHVARFAGIAPLRFIKTGNGWRVSLSSKFSYIGYFFMAISNLIMIWSIIVTAPYIQIENINLPAWLSTRSKVWVIEIILKALIASVMVYSAPKQMRCLIICLNQVQKINSVMNIHNWPTQCQKKQIGLFIFWVITIMVFDIIDFVILITSTILSRAGTSLKLSYCLHYAYFWIIQLGMVQFALVLLHVRSNFKTVNDSLRKLFQVNTTTTMFNHVAVRRLVNAYASACGVVRDANRSHGLKLLMMLGFTFVYLVISPYYLITNIITDFAEVDQMYTRIYFPVQGFWCLLYVFNLVIIIEPCHLTHKEMETTRELVGQLIRRTDSINDPLAVALNQFYNLVTLNRVPYKPLMVTSMTRGLVVQILGSIATYLAIMIEIK